MKKLLFSILSILTINLINAQCITPANNFGNQTISSYEVSGDVTLTLNNNNTVTLDLGTNFSTASGPDVRAYLIDSQGMSNNDLQNARISNLKNIPLGLVGCSGCSPEIPINGAKSFTVDIPTNADITDYDKIFFYCLRFDAFWDFGSITPFTNTNCSVLSINSNTISTNFKTYPNPAQSNLTFENKKQLPVSISIYNVLGSEVIKIDKNSNAKLKVNVSNLTPGIYLLRTESEGIYTTTRFIKD